MKTITFHNIWVDENNFDIKEATVFPDGAVMIREHQKHGKHENSSLVVLLPEHVKELVEALS